MACTRLHYGWFFALVSALSSPALRAEAPARSAEPQQAPSARISALAAQVRRGNQRAIDEFWNEVNGKAPLVERIPGDAQHCRVTFVWKGDKETRRVSIMGGFPSANMASR